MLLVAACFLLHWGLAITFYTYENQKKIAIDSTEKISDINATYTAEKPSTLIHSVESFMRDDGHICPDLFELLLQSGMYREYADKYMQAEQVDQVDVSDYLTDAV
ncbi:MAG: hypothetical protein K9K37_05355 [Desulfocapsa sp.]|nr:hypothetical protein [Desulfocapsa sp.]